MSRLREYFDLGPVLGYFFRKKGPQPEDQL
jgi:hypothetical protein